MDKRKDGNDSHSQMNQNPAAGLMFSLNSHEFRPIDVRVGLGRKYTKSREFLMTEPDNQCASEAAWNI